MEPSGPAGRTARGGQHPDLIAHYTKSFYAFFYVGSTEQLIVATSDLLDILKVQTNTGFFGWVCSSFPHRSRWFATMPPMCVGNWLLTRFIRSKPFHTVLFGPIWTPTLCVGDFRTPSFPYFSVPVCVLATHFDPVFS